MHATDFNTRTHPDKTTLSLSLAYVADGRIRNTVEGCGRVHARMLGGSKGQRACGTGVLTRD
jgi:hypothetical protein